MKTKKLFWLLIILSIAAMGFAFTASAAGNTSEPSLKIEGGNLSFEDSVFILYAVSHEGAAAGDVRLLFWSEPQSGENAYAAETAEYVLSPYQEGVKVNGKSCVTFKNSTLHAKNMTDYVYARAYVEKDGAEYYSTVSKYSILQYAYNQLGKTGTASSKVTLKNMLSAMLEYGAATQLHFGYEKDKLANADFYQIRTNGGLLSDGFNRGLYLSGEEVTLVAPKTDGGRGFIGWQNSAGKIVSSENTAKITVGSANETYTAVYCSAHADANKDHACDTCGEEFSKCIDRDRNHLCDNGCDKKFGTCDDGKNIDHFCDYGCGRAFGSCIDRNKDHACDYGCPREFGACEDIFADHYCDYGCGAYFGDCCDADGDHYCDLGCGASFGTCKDKNLDHLCDYGCGAYFGICADANKDHACDYGCGAYFGTCRDSDRDHFCDHGCGVRFGACLDTNFDHLCDYGCNACYGECADEDRDHFCDYGCGKIFGVCHDADGDQACDYGCGNGF